MIIAAWSGPRNLSTAMMYSFGARADCAVWDEPFYAAFLAQTGADHPMRDEVLADGITDAAEIARRCRDLRPGKPVFYQKHMCHHMVDGIPRDWFDAVRHVFLIRHPARVLASYARKRESVTLADIGAEQQTQIFEAAQALGQSPVVIDSDDIRANPRGMLGALCAAIGIPFDDGMLSWPAGPHPDDGIWAAHWYDAVHRSTGFAGPDGPLPPVAPQVQALHDAALPHYLALKDHALSADGAA